MSLVQDWLPVCLEEPSPFWRKVGYHPRLQDPFSVLDHRCMHSSIVSQFVLALPPKEVTLCSGVSYFIINEIRWKFPGISFIKR